MMGPIVDPQGTSLFETKGCVGTPAFSHALTQMAVPMASVA